MKYKVPTSMLSTVEIAGIEVKGLEPKLLGLCLPASLTTFQRISVLFCSALKQEQKFG